MILAGCTNTKVRAVDIPNDHRAGRILVFAGAFPDDARGPFDAAFAERLRSAGVDAVGALEAARTETRTVYVSQTLYGFTSFRPEQRVYGPFYSAILVEVPNWRTDRTAAADGTKAGLALLAEFGREAAVAAVEQMIDDRVIVSKG